MRYYLTPEQEARFWSYVDRSGGPDACWPWMRCRLKQGYGHVNLNGKLVLTHRVAYSLVHGDIVACVLHHCDNPPCCNPSHLFDGTKKDNTDDRKRKGRPGATPPPQETWRIVGEDNGEAVLTEELVLALRSEAASGCPQKTLAAKYGIGESQVSRIVRRLNWKHI